MSTPQDHPRPREPSLDGRSAHRYLSLRLFMGGRDHDRTRGTRSPSELPYESSSPGCNDGLFGVSVRYLGGEGPWGEALCRALLVSAEVLSSIEAPQLKIPPQSTASSPKPRIACPSCWRLQDEPAPGVVIESVVCLDQRVRAEAGVFPFHTPSDLSLRRPRFLA